MYVNTVRAVLAAPLFAHSASAHQPSARSSAKPGRELMPETPAAITESLSRSASLSSRSAPLSRSASLRRSTSAFARRLSFRKPVPGASITLGKTPLHFAAEENEEAALAEHISRGCDIDAVDERGNTPLHLACRHSHVNVAKALRLSMVKLSSLVVPQLTASASLGRISRILAALASRHELLSRSGPGPKG